MNESAGIEELARRIAGLAKKPVLSRAEHTEAQRIMREMKKLGLSNEQISALSDGKWTTSTVKGYTTGIKAPESSAWHDEARILQAMISSGMSLGDVSNAVRMHDELASRGVSIQDVASVLSAADAASMDLATLVQQTKAIAEEGLTPQQVREHIDLRRELIAAGLTPESLPTLTELARRYGEAEKALQAVSSYNSLQEIQAEIQKAERHAKSLADQRASAEKELANTRRTLAKEKNGLEALHEAERLGFGSTELTQLARLSDACGGPKAVLKMVKKNTDLRQLDKDLEQAEQELDRTQAMIQKLEAEYAHLKTAVDFCSKLIREHKFGFDAISAVFSAAQKYGEVLGVLKAIDTFGSIAALSGRLRDLQSKVAERDKVAVELKARCDEQLAELDRLHGTCLKVGAEVARVESRLNDSTEVRKVFDFISNAAPAGFDDGGPVALPLAKALQRWVIAHEEHLPHSYNAKSGLESLIRDLGA